MLTNTIITCDTEEEFVECQKKLFEEGNEWGGQGKNILTPTSKVIWINKFGVLSHSNMEWLEERGADGKKVITAKEYLGKNKGTDRWLESAFSTHSYCGGAPLYPYQIINNPKKTIMSKIVDFAKNMTLSADEKLLRKYGLKDECGDFTEDAKDIILDKLFAENEAYLIEIAKAKEAEDKK